jgi:hypothetical protein
MPSAALTAPPASLRAVRIGRVLSTLAVLFLLFDGVIKVLVIAPVVEAFATLGLPAGLAVGVGVLELVLVALYVAPCTSVLGVVLLTGYLGGATVLHVRIGNPLFSHVLFPAYVGVLLWGGLYLREPRLRTLLPLRAGRAA